ncbi:MAG TPA: cupin domain-containing protein [Candidatus Limnocylindrales bacterium]
MPFLPLVVRARSDDTGGRVEVYELGVPDDRLGIGSGPPPHVHHAHEEAFYVLEGDFTFQLEGASHAAPTGTLVVVPRDRTHHFTGSPGSRLLVFAIPGGLAGFFEELGAAHQAGRDDAEIRAELAGRYDSYPMTETKEPAMAPQGLD